ncbi:MAG: PEGA domain-containing protein [Candidatus Marinimicrobia bacterium]|nr:PEGA domain-containing protein [Candidatus Neomarinimicrobiota bacterium]
MKKALSTAVVTGLLLTFASGLHATSAPLQSQSADAQNFRKKPRIAVLPFQSASKKVRDMGLAEAVTAMIVTEIRNNSNYVAIERNQLRAVIDEKNLVELGLTQSTSRKLIDVLDVEVLLLGEIAYLENTIHIDARMVDIRSSRVAETNFVQTSNLADIRKATVVLVKNMLHNYLRPWMGNLEINSIPAGAEVYLDGLYIGTTAAMQPVKMTNLIEGRYEIKVMAGGYVEWRDHIEVSPKMTQKLNIPLIARPGSMTISSEPTDAEVYLDNKLVGHTPVTLKEVAEGEHELRITKETYKEWTRKVVVRSFQPTDVKVTLEVQPAMLIVDSNPQGAAVYFMGRQRGTTPVTLSNLTPGEVVLRITRQNYNEWVGSILLAPNERREIDAELVPQVGRLSIASRPDKASVYMTNNAGGPRKMIGTTPVFNFETIVGAYTLSLEKENYFPSKVIVNVRPESLSEITRDLQEKPGNIYVISSPANARVYLDGAFVGRSPINIVDVDRGQYVISMKLPYASSEQEVTVAPDQQADVSHQFAKPRNYATSTLLSMSLIIALYLTTGL